MLTSVLASSAVLQLTAAVMAFRLIRLTGKRTAWSLIAVALVLMSIRRIIPLYRLLSGDMAFAPDLLNELIGLVLSALMVLGVAGIAPLFSALKNSHKALRESEELYRAVFENTGTATVLIEENYVISHANAGFERLSKCSKQEIEGRKSWTEFVVKEDLDRMRAQHLLRREKRDAALKQYEFRFITNEGDIRDICLSIDVIPGTKRSVASLLDITERERNEEALLQSEHRLRRVYESGMLGMFYWNMSGQIIDANDKFLKMVGYTRDELEAGKIDWINMTPPEFRHLDDNSVKELQSTGANRTPFEKEYIRKDGTRMPIIIAGAILDEEHYNGAAFVLDITDRKRAEKALRKSECKLREAQEMAHLGYWHWDVKTGKVEWSEEVYKIFQLDRTEFTPQIDSVLAMSPWPEDHLRDKELISRAIESHGPGCYEQKFLRPDKSIGHYYSTFQGNYDEQGDLVSIVGTVLDITERKQAEEELRESERKFRETVANLDEGFYSVTLDGVLLDHNQAFNRILGFDETTDLKGTRLPDFWQNPEERNTYLQELAARGSISSYQIDAKTKVGEKITILASAHFVKDRDNHTLRIEGVFLDITDRKRTEEALSASEIRYRRLFESAKDGILILDAETGMVVDVNPFLIEMLGYSRDQFLEKTVWGLSFLHDIVAGRDNFERLQREKYIRYNDLPLETSGGRRIDVEFVSNVYEVGGNKVVQCNIRDITERKWAEQALIASEIRYRRLFESAKDGILILDAETGMVVDVNPFLIELLGYSHEQFLGKTIWEVGFISDTVASKYNFRKLQEEKYVRYDDLPLETSDGRQIEVEFVSNVYDVGEAKVIQCNVRDVTGRKQAREALIASEIKYRRLFESAKEGILILDADTAMVLNVNPFLMELLGYSREQFLGKTIWEVGFLSDTVASKYNFRKFQQEKYIRYDDLPLETSDGRQIDVEFVGHVYEVGDKQVFQCNIRDVTERKKAVQALRKSEQKLKATVYGSPIPQFSIDRDHRVVYWNKALEEISGLKAEEMVGTDNYWSAFYAEKRPCMCDLLVDGHADSIPEWYGAQCRKSSLVADAFEVTDFFPHLGNGGKWLFFTAVPIKDSAGDVIGAMETLEDVTGRIKAEMEIRVLNEDLEQRVIDRTAQLQAANKELEAFSYSVSHDLRAPLRALDGFSRILIEDYAAQLPDEALGHLNRVRNGASQMGHLIDDLLRFSRLSRQPLQKQPVNLSALVEETWSALESERKGRQVELVIGFLPGCQGDPSLLKQVFLNLLSNALKYSRHSTDARIEIGCLPQVVRAGESPATNVIFVKDNGVGFEMRFADKLFGVFQRLHRVEEYEGTGVGLAIVHRIIARHGGRVWAESEPDKGATFYLTIGDVQVPTLETVEKAMV
jgi:PAS domain S-box-containing protein